VHILLILAAIAALVFWFYRVTEAPTAASMGASSAAPLPLPSGLAVAFIAAGKLFCKTDGGPARQIFSPYIQEIEDRLARGKERHAWKENTSFQVSASGQMRQIGSEANIQFNSALFHQDRALLYFLRDKGIGGLFSYDLDTGVETRILHKQYLDLSDLHLDASGRKLLCSSAGKDGAANIVSLDIEGNALRELTGGDTVDAAPAWIPGDENSLLYQSAGLARNPQGYVVAHGNSTIQKLNLRSGSIEAVLEAPGLDYLHPRVCARGNLYFIRRPYERPTYSSENILMDTLLFPFRLLRAIFHYLNFFSLMYSRKPLTGAAGPAVNADLKEVILKGRRINAEKALREGKSINGIVPLVPRSWELVMRAPDGAETVLATSVASYDLTADGTIVYSNGRALYLLERANATLILKDDLVGDVAAATRQATPAH